LEKQAGRYHLIERDNEGETVKLVESIVEVIFAYKTPTIAFEKLAHPDVKVVTFTVTEAGYFYNCSSGDLNFEHPSIAHDLVSLEAPSTLFGYLARGLQLRRERGVAPFTVQSCDNIQGNGDLVKRLLLQFCSRAYPDVVSWIEENVTFPNR
jgi:mannitol 2-dehydrogenase